MAERNKSTKKNNIRAWGNGGWYRSGANDTDENKYQEQNQGIGIVASSYFS